MIIRTLSSKWGMGSDLSFLSEISYEQQAAGRPIWMPRRPLSFLLMLFLPLPELPLPFLTLEEFLHLREQDPRQGFYLMGRDTGAIVVSFLLCQVLTSVINFTKAHTSSFRVLCRSFLLGSADRLSLPCQKIMYRYNENLTFPHSFNVRNILPVSFRPVKPYAGRKSKARKTRCQARFIAKI